MESPESHIPTVEEQYASDIARIIGDRHIRRTTRMIDINGAKFQTSTGAVLKSDDEKRQWVGNLQKNKKIRELPWDVVTVALQRCEVSVRKEMESRGQA